MVRKKSLIKDSLREILFNKKRFISLLVITLIGAGLYVGLKSTSFDMKKTANDYYKKTNLFDIKIVSPIGFSNSDKYLLKNIKAIKGISFSKSLDAITTINNKDYTIKLNSINKDRSLNNEDYINRLVLTKGKYPSTINEGLVEEKFLKESNLTLGDLITLKPEDNDSLRAKKIKIVGTVKSSYYVSNDMGLNSLNNKENNYYIYLEENDFSSNYYNECFITINKADRYDTYSNKYKKIINKNKTKIDEIITESYKLTYDINISALNNEIELLKNELNELNQTDLPVESLGDMVKQVSDKLKDKENKLEKINNYNVYSLTRFEDPNYYKYKLETEKIENVSNVFSLLFFIFTTMVSLIILIKVIKQQKKQIGILRSLGYEKTEIMFKYILYAFLISFLGCITGILLFHKLIPLLISFCYNKLYDMPIIHTNIQINHCIFIIVLSCIINVITTLFTFMIIIRKNSAELMSESSLKNEKINKISNKLSFKNKMLFENIFRNKKESIITIVCVLISTVLIIVSFGIKDSSSKTINSYIKQTNKHNITYNIKNDLKNKNENYIEELSKNTVSTFNNLSIFMICSASMLTILLINKLFEINIKERSQGITNLKIMGFYNRNITCFISKKRIILSIIGIILGLILGSIFVYFITTNIFTFKFKIKISSYILTFIIVLILILIINIFTYFKIKRINNNM